MMLRRYFLWMLLAALLCFVPVCSGQYRENPSLYSVGEIVQKSPEMWMANPIEVMEMMDDYPDFTCWRSGAAIGCQSNNNKNCAEIYLTFTFTDDSDYAEYEHISFTMVIDNTEEIQKVLELFWLEDMEAAKIYGVDYPDGQVMSYFSTENTMMKYGVLFTESGDVYLLHVDIGYVRG